MGIDLDKGFFVETFDTDFRASARISEMLEKGYRIESGSIDHLLSLKTDPFDIYISQEVDLELLREALPQSQVFVYNARSHKFSYLPGHINLMGFCHRCEAPLFSDQVTTKFESDWGESKDFCQDCTEELSHMQCSLCDVKVAPGQLVYRRHGENDLPDVVCKGCRDRPPLSERVICCSI